MTNTTNATAPSGPVEPLWSDDRIRASAYSVATTMPNGLKMVSLNAMRGQMERMRDTYEAKLNEYQGVYLYYIDQAEQHERDRAATAERVEALEAQVAELQSKFETAKECAEIMGKHLEEARGLLAANGIYEDEGGDDE